MNTPRGWNVEFWNVNLVVRMLTTLLRRVNSYSCLRSSLIPQKYTHSVYSLFQTLLESLFWNYLQNGPSFPEREQCVKICGSFKLSSVLWVTKIHTGSSVVNTAGRLN
jgi:hypothetical protein